MRDRWQIGSITIMRHDPDELRLDVSLYDQKGKTECNAIIGATGGILDAINSLADLIPRRIGEHLGFVLHPTGGYHDVEELYSEVTDD